MNDGRVLMQEEILNVQEACGGALTGNETVQGSIAGKMWQKIQNSAGQIVGSVHENLSKSYLSWNVTQGNKPNCREAKIIMKPHDIFLIICIIFCAFIFANVYFHM